MSHACRSTIAATLISSALISFPLLGGPASAARLQGHLEMCENQRLCPWYEAQVMPPQGWVTDKEWTGRYKAVMMFPGGRKDKSTSLMYVRAHQGEPALTLEDYIKGAQQKWSQRNKDSKIEKVDDLAREGKPTISVYYYRNPSVADQGYELTAFMKDTSPDYKDATFFFQIVLSAPSKKELDKARPAFFELLKGL